MRPNRVEQPGHAEESGEAGEQAVHRSVHPPGDQRRTEDRHSQGSAGQEAERRGAARTVAHDQDDCHGRKNEEQHGSHGAFDRSEHIPAQEEQHQDQEPEHQSDGAAGYREPDRQQPLSAAHHPVSGEQCEGLVPGNAEKEPGHHVEEGVGDRQRADEREQRRKLESGGGARGPGAQ